MIDNCTTSAPHPNDVQVALRPSESLLAPLEIEVVPWSQLSPQHLNAWNLFRAESSRYRSPFFSHQFANAVARVRDSVHVLIIRRNRQVVGLLPFEQVSGCRTIPVGGAFNDAQGILCSTKDRLDYADLVGVYPLKSFAFHALEGEGMGYEPYVYNELNSYLADLSRHPNGYVPFLEETRATIFKQRRKTKKMIKDLGPLRLDFDCRDPQILETLIDLKRSQYQRTYIFDILSVEWARSMLRILWEEKDSPCRGIVSALFAGKTLVAVHYGLIEGDWLHYWFPTYDPKYHQYSPGTALFLEIARNAKELGLSKVDMGYGEQPYKLKLTDTVTSMPQGLFDRSAIRWHGLRSKRIVVQSLKKIPFKESAKKIVRGIWPSFGQSKYQ